MGNRLQFFAVQGTVVAEGKSSKFSVKVTESVAKGIRSKDKVRRRDAFNALANRVRQSISKKQGKTGCIVIDRHTRLTERELRVMTIRRI